MNEQKSWDASLVKKFSSSNHLKLINQLRSEVIKYPLKKKNNLSSNISKDSKFETKSKDNTKKIDSELISSINSNVSNDLPTKKSTVSFNNAKNFSIYNHNNDFPKDEIKSALIESNTENNDSSTSTFKERLDQIDLK
ncbi:hypothetical protein [Prochlorococcus marinus]|uniref:Uncharacterized protein n=1 Tax=Prochlorococcus marinus XMU1408 TaxID=2213228 RepID=A0A318R0S2_PROMR|nr:hypothetical protein [Prochlorococcus marinus]MBW3041982.1 hypothetical protein [Prochlorococcus marinus str. XMU1408]PYE03107.1 hypothetical protein DNJ73_05040 [Prochlorococcus marinus XMU1408]